MFTRDDGDSNTLLYGPSYPPIDDMCVTVQGVEKLLSGIDPNKASGPDRIPCRMLKELAPLLAPVLAAIFQQSLEGGTLPSVWLKAPQFSKRVQLVFQKIIGP